ncbi:MAG: acetylglutamate kinase [Armatimonadota bacterium]|jgi:acetylglutamate kinase
MKHVDERAQVLIEALPYIQRFAGETIVVKHGGSAMEDPELRRAVARDIVLMHCVGIRPIVVHGGGPRISAMMERLGIEPEFVDGLRVTPEQTMEVAQMVLVGSINKEIVSLINAEGGRAIGLSGKDANLIRATKLQSETDLGYVGEVESIDAGVLETLAEAGYTAVVSPIGIGPNGESYNINADHVAAEFAVAVRAAKLIHLTDVPGVLADPDDDASVISTLNLDEARELLDGEDIGAGMIPKLQSAISAVDRGVPRAHIIDGRMPHASLIELFTDRGIGTMISEPSPAGD